MEEKERVDLIKAGLFVELIKALQAQFAEAGGSVLVVIGPNQEACEQEYENYLSSGCIPPQTVIFKREPGYDKARVLTEEAATSNQP